MDAPFFTLSQGGVDIIGGWLICFFTLSVFSFLYRDNPFYKIAEHTFVGIGTAFFTLEYYEQGILNPLAHYIENAHAAPAGEMVELGGMPILPAVAIALRIVAMLLAVMLLVRLFAPNSWMPRWPLAIMVGVYAALKMTGETQSKLVAIVGNSMQPLTDPNGLSWADAPRIEQWSAFITFSRVVFFAGLICALAHFIFTYKRTKILAGVSKYGVITLMITFGAMFGFTVLGRIALLIERVANLKTYSAPAYSLAEDPGTTNLLMTPPFLISGMIILLLAIGAVQRRGKTPA